MASSFLSSRGGATRNIPLAIKTAIGQEDVAVRIESKKVAEGLDGNDSTGDGFLFGNRMLHKNLHGFPRAAAETGKKLSVIQEIPAKDFRNTENEMSMRHLLEDIDAEPLPEFHHTLLMAGRAEMTALAREGKQVFMPAVFAFDAGKTVAQIAAIEIAVDYLFDIWPPEAILPCETVVVFLHKGFKIILYAVVIIRILRLAWLVNGCVH